MHAIPASCRNPPSPGGLNRCGHAFGLLSSRAATEPLYVPTLDYRHSIMFYLYKTVYFFRHRRKFSSDICMSRDPVIRPASRKV